MLRSKIKTIKVPDTVKELKRLSLADKEVLTIHVGEAEGLEYEDVLFALLKAKGKTGQKVEVLVWKN